MSGKLPLLTAASMLLSLASTAPTAAAGEKLRGVTDPIFHLYLQVGKGTFFQLMRGFEPNEGPELKEMNTDGKNAVVAAEANAGEFTISGSVQDTASSKYLNVLDADTSYKPLEFGEKENFSGWDLEGDTLITTEASQYGRQLNFLACETDTADLFKMYLQTGGDMPSEGSCTSQTLHLPCLC